SGVDLCWLGFGPEAVYDVVFRPAWRSAGSAEESAPADYRRFANSPVRATGDRDLARALLSHVRASLPEYMVPSSVMVLPEWPLLPNGKIDRRALPLPGRASRAGETLRAPRTPHEDLLCGLFAEMLAVERVGIDDNFFDLGGHSLLAARLVSRVRTVLGVDLAVHTLFESPSVAQLSERITLGSSPETAFARVLPLRRRGALPALFCIHPGGGLSWCYAGLLRELDPARPLYGIQASGDEPAYADIASMAADYARTIRGLQANGPYNVLGASFGGMVAHAVACALQREGCEVGVLALMDAYPPAA